MAGGKMKGDYSSGVAFVMVLLSFDNFIIIMGLLVAIMFSPPDTPGYVFCSNV